MVAHNLSQDGVKCRRVLVCLVEMTTTTTTTRPHRTTTAQNTTTTTTTTTTTRATTTTTTATTRHENEDDDDDDNDDEDDDQMTRIVVTPPSPVPHTCEGSGGPFCFMYVKHLCTGGALQATSTASTTPLRSFRLLPSRRGLAPTTSLLLIYDHCSLTLLKLYTYQLH